MVDRQSFIKALRSSPVLPVASLLHDAILDCCAVAAKAGLSKREVAHATKANNFFMKISVVVSKWAVRLYGNLLQHEKRVLPTRTN